MKQKRAAVVLGYESALWPRVTAHMRFKPWNLLCAEQRLAARDLGIDRMAWPPQPGVDGVMAWRRVLSVRRALRIVFEDAISNEIMEERVGRWRMMRQWCENEETGITHYRSVAPQHTAAAQESTVQNPVTAGLMAEQNARVSQIAERIQQLKGADTSGKAKGKRGEGRPFGAPKGPAKQGNGGRGADKIHAKDQTAERAQQALSRMRGLEARLGALQSAQVVSHSQSNAQHSRGLAPAQTRASFVRTRI